MDNIVPQGAIQCTFDFDTLNAQPVEQTHKVIEPTIPQKRCTKCLQWLPATREFFYNHRSSPYRLHPVCRQCRSLRTTPLPEPVPDGYKKCYSCKEIKPVDEFHKNRIRRDGLHTSCKVCVKVQNLSANQRHSEKHEANGEKQCSNCKQVKPFSEFHKDNGYYRNTCKECRNKERSLRISIETEIPSEKWCAWCKQTKKIEEFSPDPRKKDKHRTYCRDCSNQISQIKGADKKRDRISREEYDKKLQEQDGKCAICHKHDTHRKLHLDHDHETGEIRDFLCSGCNTALGSLKEDPEIVKSLLQYIEKWKGGST